MRNKFNEQLQELNQKLTDMGSLCESIITLVIKMIYNRDHDIEKQIYAMESEIDKQEREIETLCLKLLLRQQPVAHDLRFISAALKMITDMERIGDHARDIADILKNLPQCSRKEDECIKLMAESAIYMVVESVDAFIKKDLDLVRDVIRHDDIVDNYFVEVKNALLREIAENNTNEYLLDMLMVAKYFERIGDHATNIAEWVEFSVTGNHGIEGEMAN